MINIVINSSDEYAVYAGVMLLSLFETNKNYRFKIFVFSTSISKANFANIENLASSYNNEAYLINVDSSIVESLPIKFAYHSINVYLRVLAADLIPKDIEKFIYMDCDIIVNGDIRELWETNVDNVALAASKDLPRFTPLYRKNLFLGENADYFNSGVMIINANYWRENKIAPKVFQYAKDYPDNIIACDQDAMNATLKDKFKLISRKWNVYPDVFFEHPDLFEEEYDILEEIRSKPIIIHFLYNKAWFKECRHPYKSLFYKYYELYTGRVFIPTPSQKLTIYKVLRNKIKMVACLIGIIKPYDVYDKRFVNTLERFPA